jgi:hypothetical protein
MGISPTCGHAVVRFSFREAPDPEWDCGEVTKVAGVDEVPVIVREATGSTKPREGALGHSAAR